jgi:hypothetical protein
LRLGDVVVQRNDLLGGGGGTPKCWSMSAVGTGAPSVGRRFKPCRRTPSSTITIGCIRTFSEPNGGLPSRIVIPIE